MKSLSTNEKKRLIDKSLDLEDLSIKALPDSTIDDYFFVSYSHKDYKEVYKDLLDLEESGLKIWYDRALAAGRNWEENAFKFMKPIACRGVIFYLSKNSLSSEATLQEITYAKEFGKTIIPINLPIEKQESKEMVNLSARGMIRELEQSGYVFPDAEKQKYEKVFPDNMIFLPINMAADKKAEKILANLTLPEKIVIEQDLSNGENNLLTITKVVDQNILEITEADFDKAYSKVKSVNFSYNDEDFIYTIFSIDSAVFANCYYLKDIHLSESLKVVKLSTYSFYNCENLVEVHGSFDTCAAYLKSFAGCKKLKRIGAEGCKMMLFGKSAFMNCESLEDIIINLEVGHNSIPSKSFYGCKSLKEIVLDYEDDEAIGEKMAVESSAFEGCEALEAITLPKYLERIGNSAFRHCRTLRSIRIPKTVRKIGYGAFAGCSGLESIVVEKDNGIFDSREGCNAIVQTSGNVLAVGCKNTVIPNSVLEIGIASFAECDELTSITIPDSVKVIGERAFKDCVGLKKVTFVGATEEICDDAFSGCVALENIELPSSIQSIGEGAFDRCEQLKELVIPEGVRNIGDTFAGCVSLEKIVLPKSLQYIFPGSFFRCVSLKSIIYNGTVRQWKKLMKAWEGLVIDGEQIRAGIEQALAGTSYAERISEKQDGGFNPPTNVAICSDGEAEISWLIK